MAHALSLSEQINFLGGTPVARAEKTETSPDSKTMLEQSLACEEYAITRYKVRILQA
jgi:bacterioferritin